MRAIRHILLINSDKTEPINVFKNRDEELYISVITKKQHKNLYKEITDNIFIVDTFENLLTVREVVVTIQREKKIDYIITPTEKGVLAGGFIRSFFGIDGVKFETALSTTNKLAMKAKVNNAGIPTANFRRLDNLNQVLSIADELGWPLIIKPAIGSGTRNTFKINSKEEFINKRDNTQLFNELHTIGVPMIVESFIEMDEYHCDGIIYENELVFLSISKYMEPPLVSMKGFLGSYILPKDLPIYNRLKKAVEDVVKSLHIPRGPVHIELYRTNSEQIIFGEIALRPGGAGVFQTIKKQYGISIWEKAYEVETQSLENINIKINDNVCGWIGLPCNNGKLVDFIDIESLYELDDCIKYVEQHFQKGDIVNQKISSTFHLYTIYFEVSQINYIENFTKKLDAAYYIVTV
ncbi:ATP-grasp domain-containing protein [Salipaludibacillus sp. LMS25]|jgi:hypothetical protein|uniref:ATP-grasp domain-containing protein n=1 Tax=Salipaludibacillus sp. LMS25 TaxID=2924031 RepID=UPI0020D013A5|nr:ATP-grasp domain-containing protein [Salipaludibacillus sp. LMS25]UTR15947.1 ATP-grasp domain-containing protein [Salipaludibacillus sp. LMS25]